MTSPTAGGTWYLHVKGYNGDSVGNGTYDYSVTADAGPSITSSPPDQNVTDGTANVEFTVTAGGAGLSYQWQKDTVDITDNGHYSGCTTATLTLDSASDADQGNYRCVVAGTCGSPVNSDPGELTIAPQAITWQSVKFHGGTVNGEKAFALPPASGYPIEPRRGNLVIRVTFDKPVILVDGGTLADIVTIKDSDNNTITPDTGNIVLTGSQGGGYISSEITLTELQVDKKKLTVKLVQPATTDTVMLRRPTSAQALLAGTLDREVWCLVGDTNRTGYVSMNDISMVRNMMKPPADGGTSGVVNDSNFLLDVNTSGQINIVDMALVRNKISTCGLPGMCAE